MARENTTWARDEVVAQLKKTVRVFSEDDNLELDAETDFVEDLRFDSSAIVELVLAIESDFQIDIPEEDIADKRITFGYLLRLVVRALKTGGHNERGC